MTINASDVAKLRQMTGVGMMEAKKALTETDGDIEKAIEVLRKSGAAKAAKRADRATSEGRVHCYTHGNGRIGVMVEVLSETDFVSRNESFIELCNDIAMHIAAMSPLYLSREDVPAEVVTKEREIAAEQNAGKPADVIEKILEGKIGKYFEEACLLNQRFIKDEDITIAQLMESKIASIGENLRINRFARFEIGG
ncbi:translation elongation factor Ts [Candidatus Uhrbacteria bacterium CG_4_9_14_0_2_um_filter_41_50]|uniref:Elongation factor Ts n=1 Tax=Candidatus Uhrbacteria bacterium CG_4_9_14_0_2_um_filter_41_50 TaxID=1975031 RepID=A0A2M8ENN6_9BACT|nr:MAG: translation elongation factor Ts [Candidatus Uhrbacteria bacterium CG_4_10_14_3_um_filter_41_21]PIZ54896.1 MAG: translation elongation factor Ts [Candidatus Uhrbacteria bacterium CG_4_10_14_0_2_um_filter_41_21]PJB84513.1 MAG: translation elongation factor Ts [Candidatus Uhrbacteria bacterium CG_4_9_14_0_8_um_filter_41_16]PJC24267.1 MAG: translation elongation factor Ts [Candidatus Uhrbacteria bacterium CG_4_9_14_0_2_um_filter_41_50]PJE74701.1 MAG: translation elongation factor Ts [Candi